MKRNINKLSFSPLLEAMYCNGSAIGRTGKVINATGLSSINNLLTIREIILYKKPTRTLEIGMAYGGSALTFLSTLQENFTKHKSEYFHKAIDPYQKEFDYSGCEVIKKAGLASRFDHIEKPSELALPKLFESGEKFDLIYIDGSHVFEHVFIDLIYSLMLLNPGGIMLFDDCMDAHVAKVIKFAKTNLVDFIKIYPLDEYQINKDFLKKAANYFGYSQLKAFIKTQDLPRPWNVPFTDF